MSQSCVLCAPLNRTGDSELTLLSVAKRKRLKLPVSIMVHVEHDPIAVEVCKFNHRDDGIKHHYIEKFEDIYGADDDPNSSLIAMLVETYGPFDLVLSGSPCQSYSGLNASRDQTSDNARYLCKVGWLIQKLDEIQMESEKANEKVLFVSENVVFGDHDEVDKCYTDHRGGLHPVCLDAKDFGPCKRNRFCKLSLCFMQMLPMFDSHAFCCDI